MEQKLVEYDVYSEESKTINLKKETAKRSVKLKLHKSRCLKGTVIDVSLISL